MTGTLLDWLMRCPTMTGISALALESHELGLIDLRRQIAKAVAADVRAITCGSTIRMQTMSYHENQARVKVTNRTACLDVDGGVARIRGWIGRNAAISEARDRAVIHVRTQLPESVLAAATGRCIIELVDTPLLRRHPHRVISAHQDEDGIYIWFEVPKIVWSMNDVAAAIEL